MILEGKGLVKAFGGLTAVNEFDITVKTGEIVGLIGPNGAGKSTIVGLLAGSLPVTRGQILLDGKDITRSPVQARSRMGIIRTFQLNSVWRDMSVMESLETAYYCQRTEGLLWKSLAGGSRSHRNGWTEEASQILDMLGVAALWKRRVADLTYEHQRMVSIAAALMARPGILLLDEPIAGMNWEESVALLEAVRKVMSARELGVLLIEHNVQAITKFASRMVAMSFGRKLTEGTVEEVTGSDAVIEAYLGRKR